MAATATPPVSRNLPTNRSDLPQPTLPVAAMGRSYTQGHPFVNASAANLAAP